MALTMIRGCRLPSPMPLPWTCIHIDFLWGVDTFSEIHSSVTFSPPPPSHKEMEARAGRQRGVVITRASLAESLIHRRCSVIIWE